MHLVLISTSGNQSYIFASNRLREAVGASRLVTISTTDWVNQALDTGTILQATSGSTLVTVPDEPTARALTRAVTVKALREAPGLAVRAVHVPIDDDVPTGDEITRLFRTHAEHVASRPSVAARHQRVPAVAACDSTDWPAARWHTDDPRGLRRRDEKELPTLLSEEVIAKRRERPAAQHRFAALLTGEPELEKRRLIEIDDLFDDVDWVGVVHADGNRLGAFFRAATGHLGGARLGALSQQVQKVSDEAFRAAVLELSRRVPQDRFTGRLPIVPLIVGGDDLTALVDGEHVLAFTEAYLTAFADRSADQELITEMLEKTGAEVLTLTASAGVAIVKPHFPFSVAYALAEELCGNAKAVLAEHPGLHGVDVHVLIDSIAGDLTALRARYDAATRLTQRPFLLGAGSAVPPPERDWARVRDRLHTIAAIPKGGDGVLVTRTQLHALRSELRTDVARAWRRLADLDARVPADGPDRVRLAALRPADGPAPGLLDLLELAPFAGAGA